MCDHHHMRGADSQAETGEIEHVNDLSDNVGALYMHTDYSDVTLLVEGKRFPAHKVVLAARSEYFR